MRPTLLCFSHLRWNFVWQRPQHLMTRFARDYEILFFEEPVPSPNEDSWLEVRDEGPGIRVLVPRLAPDVAGHAAETVQRMLLDEYLENTDHTRLLAWYYTPMSLVFSDHLNARLVIYDCMDELSAFRGAPAELVERERQLLARADAVFTGGHSLYEAKRRLHGNAHPFPSSVDISHFARARAVSLEPVDQASIPHPRLGFYGVLDERLDTALVDELAAMHPEWNLIFVGPVVKIDPATLPRRPNIHYLGPKEYAELPAYLGGWDVALMPFAMNESTRFISPTKTPEYLAGGRAVVSTPIVDVMRTYGSSSLVGIAGTASDFAAAIQRMIEHSSDRQAVYREADAILGDMSWDATWQAMSDIMRASMRPAPGAAGLANQPSAARLAAVDGRTLPELRDARIPATGSQQYDYLVVGAGFAGSVLAERLAAGSNKRVLVIDRRPHIGGNAFDEYNGHGILVHRYGPHIFHTNSAKVKDYLSRFTGWRQYEHRVLAQVNDMLVPMPINLTTLSRLYGQAFTPESAAAFLAERAEHIEDVRTSEDVVVSAIGRELYEAFFRGYTRKQWGLDPSELDKSVAARVPTRTSSDDRYFTDEFQCMPLHGYTRMFENMLDHPNITVATGTEYEDVRDSVKYGHTIYCGPIDEFFDYRYGRLPYRSLRFEHVTLDEDQFQPVGVVNFPSESVPYTRITEYKHLTGQKHAKTSLTYEIPSAEGDPYYPVPRPENNVLFRKYQALADARQDVTFVGRLATYRYYNMDQVVAQALAVYTRLSQQPTVSRAATVASMPAAQGA